MTTPTTNLKFSSIQAELGGSNPISLSEYTRGGVLVNTNQTSPNGTIPASLSNISMAVFRAVTKYIPAFAATISSNQTNLNLRTWALANGWNGTVAAIITIASGVYVYATTTAGAGLTINGSWPGGITVINNGYIMGKGGAGGMAPSMPVGWEGANGNSGGPAMSLGISCTIQNNSYIGGGGGGGASAAGYIGAGGGGGAGGGAGGGLDGGNRSAAAAGGAGGGVGAAGSRGPTIVTDYYYGVDAVGAGGGGGGIMPGAGGAGGGSGQALAVDGNNNNNSGGFGGGAGGGGGGFIGTYNVETGGAGGSGGLGGAGAAGFGAGGGGWGAAGGNAVYVDTTYYGGVGGKAVALNGYAITWSATGTRYGAIS